MKSGTLVEIVKCHGLVWVEFSEDGEGRTVSHPSIEDNTPALFLEEKEMFDMNKPGIQNAPHFRLLIGDKIFLASCSILSYRVLEEQSANDLRPVM